MGEYYSFLIIDNTNGQLNLSYSSYDKCISNPQLVSLEFEVEEIACGERNTLLLDSIYNNKHIAEGKVYTVDTNTKGKVSSRSLYGPTLLDSLSHIKYISCGWSHFVAVDNRGSVYSWGYSKGIALGHGGSNAVTIPRKVQYFEKLGVRIREVACGGYHTAFISEDGDLFACGSNQSGQLGIGSKQDKDIPVLLKSEGKVRQVGCGLLHTLFITEKGNTYATGNNNFGQLGTGNKVSTNTPVKISLNNVKAISCGHHSAAITHEGNLFIWGTGSFGELLSPTLFPNVRDAEELKLGACFGVVRDANDNIWTWGTNTSGELATNDYEPRAKPSLAKGIKDVNKIACGSSFVIARVRKKELDMTLMNKDSLVSSRIGAIINLSSGERLEDPLKYFLSTEESPVKEILNLGSRLSLENTMTISKQNALKIYKEELEQANSVNYSQDENVEVKRIIEKIKISCAKERDEAVQNLEEEVLKLRSELNENKKKYEKRIEELMQEKKKLKAQVEEAVKATNDTLSLLKKENQEYSLKIESLVEEKLRLSVDLERVLIENSTFLGLLEQYENVNTTVKVNKEIQTEDIQEITFKLPNHILTRNEFERALEQKKENERKVLSLATNRVLNKSTLRYLWY